jgi:D-aminoacyl-tRNA deacylase
LGDPLKKRIPKISIISFDDAQQTHRALELLILPAWLDRLRLKKNGSGTLRAVVQRVDEAAVLVDGRVVGQIARGLAAFVGVDIDDTEQDASVMAEKIAFLRCFEDADSKFNLSVQDVGGSVLAISQFTVHGDCRKGRRPSFTQAARPDTAVPLYELLVRLLREKGLSVETGVFGAHMEVRVVNNGPVTLLIDTKKVF